MKVEFTAGDVSREESTCISMSPYEDEPSMASDHTSALGSSRKEEEDGGGWVEEEEEVARRDEEESTSIGSIIGELWGCALCEEAGSCSCVNCARGGRGAVRERVAARRVK
jgi:hypothetical protein